MCQDTAARIAELEHLSDRPHIERAQLTRNAVRNASVLPLVTPATLSSPSLMVDLPHAVDMGTVDHKPCLLGRWAQSRAGN